jgi:penicillin-binding protein 2
VPIFAVAPAAFLVRFGRLMRAFLPFAWTALGLFALPAALPAQQAGVDTDAGVRTVSNERLPIPETIEPTWETRPDWRTVYFEIPAPRGQITDRDGQPLAQSKLGYHLDLNFPTGEEMSDQQVFAFVQKELVLAQAALHRPMEVTTDDVLDHYHNRRMLPMDIATYLTPEEVESARNKLGGALSLRQVYLRFYPNGSLAAHIIGYAGKTAGQTHGPLQPSELLWPDLEGREGLEKTFNEQLVGKPGVLNMTFDGQGRKTSERIVTPPIPGNNVVTTLDLNLQKLCEQTLAKEGHRGAIVVMDPWTGDVLAMASWPSFDPNEFVPSISDANFNKINNDPNIPLIPRAFRASYPAGSTFKIIVGAAALNTKTISKNDEFTGPPSMYIGEVLFHNWKKTDAGDLNFVQALAQSCDTWFYQVGIKTGAEKITDYAKRFGLGRKTGLPLRDESAGLLPDNAYMERVHKRKFHDGDIANLSIGQGDLEVTPIQMAQAMATLANGGTLHQTRLVKQVQTLDDVVTSAYEVHSRSDVGLTPDVLATLKKGMVAVVDHGTGGQARVSNLDLGGKTGTAQWGAGNQNKAKSRTAAWFVGFAPMDKPKYAFAALAEGDPGDKSVHGPTAAALIGKVMGEVYKDTKPEKKKKKADNDDDEDKPTPAPDDSSSNDD